MLHVRLSALVLAGVFASSVVSASVITENFTTDPLQDGWQVFGDTNLFQWNAASHQLAVTWDSTQTNSYFYYPLDGYLTRYDDFSFEFDLQLSEAASGVEPGKIGSLQAALGFLRQSSATNSDFSPGQGLVSDIAEFCYYPLGYYVWPPGVTNVEPPTTVPSFVSSASSFAPGYLNPYYVLELPTNKLLHVVMAYTASNQTATVTVTANGLPLGPLPGLALNVASNSEFLATDDYHVDMFSISSYSSTGDPYDSLLAKGTVANLQISLPPPAQDLRSLFTNGVRQVQFSNRTNWLYTLERTTNFASWSGVSPSIPGNGATLMLQDPSAPPSQAFYRVRADRP
jgi:hypothetical protein